MNAEDIEQHLFIFQNLLTVILKRRSQFRTLEETLRSKNIPSDKIYANQFVMMFITDYSRNQLIDLRKLFENNNRSYRLSSLRDFAGNPELKMEQDELYNEWKKKFSDQTDQVVAHIDKDRDSLGKQIFKTELDEFINKANRFLDHIVEGLKTKSDVSVDESHRDPNGNYLNEDSVKDFKEFVTWANS